MKYKFPLIFNPQRGPVYRQLTNLTSWLESREIEYEYVYTAPGVFYPSAVVVSEDDASLVMLTFDMVKSSTNT